jgi:hypothetical protein
VMVMVDDGRYSYEFKGGSEMTLPLYVFLRTNVPTFFWCAVSELTPEFTTS